MFGSKPKNQKPKDDSNIENDPSPTSSEISKLAADAGEQNTTSQFKDFIKTVMSFTGDLSSLTCPASFLNGLSLLEYGAYWGDHPECFTAISESKSPEERMLRVARWFISTLWGSYASRCTNGHNECKPYNPILGEQFLCNLGSVKCICEQVSHHPPVSAFYLEEEQAGLSLNGHSCQKSKFRIKSASIKVEQVGRAVLTVNAHNEVYLIDFPDLIIRGFRNLKAYIELSGTCTIACSNGISTEIEFIPKPWIGGEYNHIKGKIKDLDNKVYYELSGRWSHKSYFQSEAEPSEKQLLFDAEDEKMAERATQPEEKQEDFESHKLWGKVTAAIKSKDYATANKEKNKIETKQREIRDERKAKKETWSPKLFKFVNDTDAESPRVKQVKELQKRMVGPRNLDEGAWEYTNQLCDRQ